MNQYSLLPQPAYEDRLYLKVIFKKEATILNCLSLSERLKEGALVEETFIFLTPMAFLVEGCLFQTEHAIKVFLKKEVCRKEGLELAEDLKTQAWVKETELCFSTRVMELFLIKVTLQNWLARTRRLLAGFQKRRLRGGETGSFDLA